MKFELRAVYDFPNSTDNRDLDCESYPIDDVPETDRYGKADKIGLYVRDEEWNLFHVMDFDTLESARQSLEAFREFQELLKRLNPVETKAVISYDDNPENPREWWSEYVKLHFRKHTRYALPEEIEWFSFEDVDNEDVYETLPDGTEITVAQHQERELEKYYVFNIDCYEHGWIVFSISGSGTQCQFDTAKFCWFWAVERERCPGWIDEARKMVEDALEQYNHYINGKCYSINIYDRIPLYTDSFDHVWFHEKYFETIDWFNSQTECRKELESLKFQWKIITR